MRPAGQSLSTPRARVPPRADADECRRYRLGVASTLFAQAALNAAEAVEQACRRGALLSTGMAPLDEALGGGLQTGEVVELVGASGSGKSQACMAIGARQLAASDWHVLYIDTALSFTAERMLQLVQLELSEATPAAGADGGAAAAAADPRQLGKRRLRERLRVVSEASCRPALRARVARRGALELHRRRVVVCSDTSETLPRPFRGPSEALPRPFLPSPPSPLACERHLRLHPACTAAAADTPADTPPHTPTTRPQVGYRRLKLLIVDSAFAPLLSEAAEDSRSLAGAQLARLQLLLRQLAARWQLSVLVTNAAPAGSNVRPPRPREADSLSLRGSVSEPSCRSARRSATRGSTPPTRGSRSSCRRAAPPPPPLRPWRRRRSAPGW